MAVASRKELVTCVTKSNAIPAEKLKAWLEVVDEEDPKKIAVKLVRDKLLTSWQAKFLLSGRSRLSVGNYLLQSRISRDDLGDKFDAIHTQLNRRVVIQVFPSSVSKNEALLQKLLTKLRQITELDHPNLVHVYDVDQESERYFLVTEFVEGQTMDQISPSDLSESEIGVIVQGVAAGLSYAHENKIIHGNLIPENIIVTPKGKAELQGFPSATVTSETDEEATEPTAATDFRSLRKIGLTLLKELPEKLQTDQYKPLQKMIAGLKDDNKREASIAKLDQWVSEYTAVEADASDMELQPEEDSFISSEEPVAAGGFDSPVAAIPPAKLKKKKKPVPEPEPEPRGFLKTMWEDKRGAFIASAAALFLFVAGGLGALGYVISGALSDDHLKNPQVATVGSQANKSAIPLATSNAAEGALLVDREDKAMKETLDPEANRKKLAEFFAKRDAAKVEEAKEEAEAEKPKEAEPPKTEAVAEAVVPEEAVVSSETQPATVEAESKVDLAEATKEPPKAASVPEPTPPVAAKKKKPAEIGNPFEKFTTLVDLPESTETGDHKIGDLVIQKNHLLGLELLAEPGIARGKINFSLKRSPDDKQLWDVELTPKRSDPIAVAQFQKTPTEMKFRWLPAAAENNQANYLRNCKLKLLTPKDSAWLGLRKPTAIEGFSFAEDGATIKTETEIKWLPNPAGIKVELQPFEMKGRYDRIGFLPREVTKRQPGRIFFRPTERERIFFIDVSAEIRKKTRFTAQMNVLLPDGQTKPMRKLSNLTEYSNALGIQKTEAVSQFEQAKEAKKPKEMSKTEFNGLKKEVEQNAKKLTSMFEISEKYVELGEQFPGLAIPLQVFFDMDGHRILIAESK